MPVRFVSATVTAEPMTVSVTAATAAMPVLVAATLVTAAAANMPVLVVTKPVSLTVVAA